MGFLGFQKFSYGKWLWKIDWHLIEALKPEELKLQKEEGFISAKWVNFAGATSLFTYKDFLPFLDKANQVMLNSAVSK